MSREALNEAVRELGWSIFGELGVPGVVRHHRGVVIDPEPILVAAPSFFDLDARLRDQAYGWCQAHADWVSVSRLRGLLRQLPAPARQQFGAFAATLHAGAKVRWPAEGAQPWARIPAVRPPALPLQRPAMMRLRLRALSGVGARADVLAELIGRPGLRIQASQLAEEGYSKRAIAGILAELSSAGLARSLPERNALTYELSRPECLRELVGAQGLVFPSWRKLMHLVLGVMELARLEAKPATVRRVEANKLQGTLRMLCQQLRLEAPPPTRGNRNAWEDSMAWAIRVVSGL